MVSGESRRYSAVDSSVRVSVRMVAIVLEYDRIGLSLTHSLCSTNRSQPSCSNSKFKNQEELARRLGGESANIKSIKACHPSKSRYLVRLRMS